MFTQDTMENKISIAKPCNENWNSMLPNEKGKFCMSCNKTVVDFTKMKNADIQKYFEKKSNSEEICGIFRLNQIASDNNSNYSKFTNRFNRIKIKPIKLMALFLLGSLFSLSSCIMGKAAEAKEESELISSDSIHENDVKNKFQNKEQKKDSLVIDKESNKQKR